MPDTQPPVVVTDAIRILKDALFVMEKQKARPHTYGGVLTDNGKRAWIAYGLFDEGDRPVLSTQSSMQARIEELEAALRAIANGSELSERHFEARLAARKNRLSWFVVNVIQDGLAACKGSARAALSNTPGGQSNE